MSVQQLLEKLRELKPVLAARYHVREVSLFGSLTRQNATPSSDIDLLVEFEKGADLFDLVGLSLFLEDELGRPVDVVPKGAIRDELRREILEQALVV